MRVPTVTDNIIINFGNVCASPSSSFASLTLNGGTLSGTLTVLSTMNWTGGALGGDMTVAPGGVLNISGASDKGLGAPHVLDNAGTVNWSDNGDVWVQDSSVFNPLRTVQIDNRAGASFNVAGDGDFLTGIGTIISGSAYRYLATLVFSNAGWMGKTGGTGTNAFLGSFDNSGTVEAHRGTLQFSSGYVQTATGTLRVGIAGEVAGSQFGRISVIGQATLAGALEVAMLNGFQPAGTNRSLIMTYGSHNGIFSSFAASNLAGGLTLTPNYTSTSITLLTTDTRPRLSPVALGPNEQLGFTITTLDGQSYRIEASTNLVQNSWETLTNFPAGPGVFRFVDPAPVNYPHRFYRAVAP